MIKQLIDEALVAHGFVSKRDLDTQAFIFASQDLLLGSQFYIILTTFLTQPN